MSNNDDYGDSLPSKRVRILSPPETPITTESNEDKFSQLLKEAAACHNEQLAEKESTIKSLNSENTKLKAQLKDARKRIQDIASLESKVKEKDEEISKLQVIADSKETIIKEKEEALSLNKKLQINFKEMTKKFEGSEKEREKILTDNKNLQVEISSMKMELNSLKKEKQEVLDSSRGIYNYLERNYIPMQIMHPPPPPPQSVQQIYPLQNPQEQQQQNIRQPQCQTQLQPFSSPQTPRMMGNSVQSRQPNPVRPEDTLLRSQYQISPTSGQRGKPRF